MEVEMFDVSALPGAENFASDFDTSIPGDSYGPMLHYDQFYRPPRCERSTNTQFTFLLNFFFSIHDYHIFTFLFTKNVTQLQRCHNVTF